jgi:hypothetical protein
MKIFGVTSHEKGFSIYKSHDNGDIILYEGIEKMVVPYKDWKAKRAKYVDCEWKFIPCDPKRTMEETYNDYVLAADTLKKETKGFINLYKSGTISQTALSVFERLTKVVPEPITAEESIWIDESTIGAIAWAKPFDGNMISAVSIHPSCKTITCFSQLSEENSKL